MRPERIIALKEFRDHLTSKRFLVIFAIFLLMAVFGMVTGMSDYNKQLESYKKNQQENQQSEWYQEQVASLQNQIAKLEAEGGSKEELDSLKYQLDIMINPPMPSVLTVFFNMSTYFMFVGGVLAVSMGFDLISREKEEGSLKSLLSHPVYRDSIINGKSIAALMVLVVVMAATFLITISIMLFYSVIPGTEDLVSIFVYFVVSLLYCLVFFAIALMTSTIAKNSAMSVLYAVGIILFLIIVPMISYPLVEFIVGPPPEINYPMPRDGIITIAEGDITANVAAEPALISRKIMPNDEYQQYWEKKQKLIDMINTISPMNNYQAITNAIIWKESSPVNPMPLYSSYTYGYNKDPSIFDTLAYVWTKILAILVESIIAFAVSYIVFTRMDVR